MPTASEFDEWVEANSRSLLRTAYLLSGDPHLAEDLVQSALLKAYKSWGRVTAADSPVAYVRQIVVRELLSTRRRRSSGEVVTDPAALAAGSAIDGDLSDRDVAWRLLATLPRIERTVLVLRLYEDLDDPTIASILGCALGTVRSHSSRGVARLRTSLLAAGITDSLSEDVS